MNVMDSISPLTGSATRDYAKYGERAAAAVRFTIDLYVPTEAQETLIDQMRSFHTSCSGLRDVPLPGRGLSAPSQAGKSRTISECVRRINAVSPANPNRMLHIGLTERITIKMLYQRILAAIGDPEAFGRYSLELLRQRCSELLPQLGVELLAIDEVQLIGKQTNGNYEVADALKSLLDHGIVGILFAGNEKASDIFEVNPQLRGRMGAPLELPPANPRLAKEMQAFRSFLAELDERITRAALLGKGNLSVAANARRLGKSGGGHIGRTCRIVGTALEHACARGADAIEGFDLSFAVEHLALPAGWCKSNAFAKWDHR